MIYKLMQNRVRRTYRGGSRIDDFTGENINVSDGIYLPEDWTASVTKAFYGSVEIDGEGLGRTTDGKMIKDIVGSNLPILVKLLDSDERLVIQAHPTREFAQKVLGLPYGKTECWYFLDCLPDACVYLGFRKGITREKFKNAFNNNDSQEMLSMLHRIPVKPGDFVFVDGGVPHAIGAGCFIIELQEPSDLIVVGERYTPSGMKIAEKKLHMGLGYEKMFDVYDFTGYEFDEIKEKYCPTPKEIDKGIYEILGSKLTDKFSMYRLEGETNFKLSRPYAVAIVAAGEGRINETCVKKGDRLLISDENIIITGNVEIIICI